MIYIMILLQSFLIDTNPETWTTDFTRAKEMATAQNKNILMVFSGSDWCLPCKKLKKSILLSDEFRVYEQENLIVLYLDFPMKKKNKLSKEATKHNEALAESFNSSGNFPKIILLDQEGNTIKAYAFDNQEPEEFIKELSL